MYLHKRHLHQNYRRQRGMSLIELLGAIGIGVVLMMGLVALIDNALEDSKGQQASLYQAQVTDAAAKYIAANYPDIVTKAPLGGGPFAITLATLQNPGGPGTPGFLPAGFANINGYGQNTCILVRQSAAGQLNALVVTYGGTPIGDKDIPMVATNAGKGGGYISRAAFTQMQGTSWALTNADAAPYRGVSCGGGANVLTGTVTDGGHLVSMIFQQGQAAADFLYRHDVDGMPDATTMSATIKMAGAAMVEENKDCGAVSAIGVSKTGDGQIMSCQPNNAGPGRVWKRQGAGTWKEPVDTWLTLDSMKIDNTDGDVRMVKDIARAFMWSGDASAGTWKPLAANQDGLLSVTNLTASQDVTASGNVTAQMLNLNKVVNLDGACTSDGQIARDGTGKLLNCYSGTWHSMEARMGNLIYALSSSSDPNDTLAPGVRISAPGGNTPIIDLRAYSSRGPYFVTGHAYCQASGSGLALVSVEIHDKDDNVLGYAGGCGTRNTGTDDVRTKGFIPLQKLPETAVKLKLVMLAESTITSDYVETTLFVYDSK